MVGGREVGGMSRSEGRVGVETELEKEQDECLQRKELDAVATGRSTLDLLVQMYKC